MEKLRATRAKNLHFLLDAFKASHAGLGEKKSQAAFAETLGLSSVRLNHLLTRERDMGEEAARKIEEAAGLPKYAMDEDLSLNKETSITVNLQNDDGIEIKEYATGGAMGDGLVLADQPGVIHSWHVNQEWLNKNAGVYTDKKNLAIVTGFGDSMRPMYNPGDPLLIDCGVKQLESDGVYFFRIGNDGFIKRLQRIPGDDGMVVWAISQNKEYKDFPITKKMDFALLGKVIRVWCGTDF